MTDFPRADLVRMTNTDVGRVEMRADDEGRTLVGLPIVFNRWTEIRGWEGHFLERIAPSALTKTLEERGDRVKVLFNHGFDPSIGDKPLGKPSRMEVRDEGLYVEVPLARTSYNDDLIELLRTGALDGMSFKFTVTRQDVDENPQRSAYNPDGLPERTITELRLLEVGPVTWPAYEATTVGVRSREAYEMLRDKFTESDAARSGTSQTDSDTPPVGAPVGTRERIRLARRRWNSGAK